MSPDVLKDVGALFVLRMSVSHASEKSCWLVACPRNLIHFVMVNHYFVQLFSYSSWTRLHFVSLGFNSLLPVLWSPTSFLKLGFSFFIDVRTRKFCEAKAFGGSFAKQRPRTKWVGEYKRSAFIHHRSRRSFNIVINNLVFLCIKFQIVRIFLLTFSRIFRLCFLTFRRREIPSFDFWEERLLGRINQRALRRSP